jgi:hypothetical protein
MPRWQPVLPCDRLPERAFSRPCADWAVDIPDAAAATVGACRKLSGAALHEAVRRGPCRLGPDPGAPRDVRVSVVIPTPNEEEYLPYVFGRLPKGLQEAIVVDSRSIDRTVAVVTQLRPDAYIVIRADAARECSLAAGFAAASGDIVVTLDVDGLTDAAGIPRSITTLRNPADFVEGSRSAHGGASSEITLTQKLGNRAHCARPHPGMCVQRMPYGFGATLRSGRQRKRARLPRRRQIGSESGVEMPRWQPMSSLRANVPRRPYRDRDGAARRGSPHVSRAPVRCMTGTWQNGNLNGEQAHYVTRQAVPYPPPFANLLTSDAK